MPARQFFIAEHVYEKDGRIVLERLYSTAPIIEESPELAVFKALQARGELTEETPHQLTELGVSICLFAFETALGVTFDEIVEQIAHGRDVLRRGAAVEEHCVVFSGPDLLFYLAMPAFLIDPKRFGAIPRRRAMSKDWR